MIELYTDGSFIRTGSNTSIGGWAYKKIVGDDVNIEGGVVSCQNILRMEAMAVLKGLRAINSVYIPVLVFSDNQILINTLNGYRTLSSEYDDLIDPILTEADRFYNVRFVWVRSHATNQHNNDVDNIVRTMVKREYRNRLGMKIEDLDLSFRNRRALHTYGITTVGELLSHKSDEIRAIRNIGDKSFLEIVDLLREMGLSFRNPYTPFRGAPLSQRTINRLVESGIFSLNDLAGAYIEDIKAIKGIGVTGYQEIVNFLRINKKSIYHKPIGGGYCVMRDQKEPSTLEFILCMIILGAFLALVVFVYSN